MEPEQPNNSAPTASASPQQQTGSTEAKTNLQTLHQGPSEYELIEQQHNMIRQQIQNESSLIGDKNSLEVLQAEFSGNEAFILKIIEVAKKGYHSYRKTRRDGSCFYRAYLFRAFEVILIDNNEVLKNQLLQKIKDSKDFLKKAGFEGLVFEDVQELFIEKLEALKPSMKTDDLVEMFRDPTTSNYLVLMLRLLTSAQLKNNAELYEMFIDNGLPIEHFCQTEVEQIDREADQIQIMALLAYMEHTPIKIIYLDGNINNLEPTTIVFPEDADGSKIKIELLYRPGHYDIIYR